MPKKQAKSPPRATTRSWKFGAGSLTCDLASGSIISIRHPKHPKMSFLLGPDEKWHHRPAHWGKGFLISGKESGRWDHPADIQISGEGIRCKYNVLDGVRLEVTRRFGERWTEEYVLKNERAKPLQIGSLAVSVPFRDVYHDAANSLTRACHAHVWTGGAASWLWALRMNGAAPGLGLALTKGELWSYSIESRNQFGSSHLRGHIYLHVTDAARAPHAMGGQPVIRVAPGADYKWSWTIKWHDNFAVFEREVVKPIVTVPSLTATLDGTITIVTRKQVTIKTPRGVKQRATAKGESVITSKHAGIQHIDIADGDRQSRVAVLFHPALRRVVERRIDFILKHQRAIEREPGRSGAFVPFDTQFGLRVNAAAWRDWSDGRERICMALLLQYARRLGWSDAGRLDAALADYDLFCKTHIVQPDGTVLEDSFDDSPERLYNYAWFAEFYMGQFDLYHRPDDALRAAAILENYYKRGGGKFLAFIDCMEAVIDTLGELGEKERADRLRANFLKHVDDFLVQGVDLPKHEVNYEQSIVAPLLLLLQAAQRIAPSSRYEKAFGRLLPWLNAFAGQQPHVRLRHVPIRHWDGYWFGRFRQWGDTFPHYWSVLSAAVYANCARGTGDETLRDWAHAIFTANLANFHEDGSATCAFLFPSCLNGSPAHMEDPLANDQDWALVWYLKYPELWPEARKQ